MECWPPVGAFAIPATPPLALSKTQLVGRVTELVPGRCVSAPLANVGPCVPGIEEIQRGRFSYVYI